MEWSSNIKRKIGRKKWSNFGTSNPRFLMWEWSVGKEDELECLGMQGTITVSSNLLI